MRYKLCTSILIILCFSNSALAQNLPDEINRQAERVQERVREEQRQREEQLRSEQQVAPTGNEILPPVQEMPARGECVTVSQIAVQGISIYPQDRFTALTEPVIGTCVFITDINVILRAITNQYIKDGYVTSRALIAPQDLADGKVEIVVIEGALNDIRAEEGKIGPSELRSAFPGLKGNILNLRDIEQGIDQMVRVPSFDPSIDIAPAQALGSSDLLIKRKPAARAIRPSLILDNDGQASTGRWQSTTTLDLDNVVGLLDFSSVYFSRNIDSAAAGDTQSFGGFVSLPHGYWTLNMSAGYSDYESIISGNGLDFVSDGETYNGSLSLERLFFRDSDTKFSATLGMNLFDTTNRIQSIRLATSSYRLVSANAHLRLQQRLFKGLLDAGLGITHGLDIFGAQAVDNGPGGPNMRFTKVSVNLSFREPIALAGVKLQYSLAMRGQLGFDPLFPAQRFSIGGSSTVRGFRDDGNSGRTGAIVRQQVNAEVADLFGSLSPKFQSKLVIFSAYDAGGIAKRLDDRFERGFLHSATFGLQVISRLFTVEIATSLPISSPSFIRHNDAEVTANIRLNF